MIDTIFLIPGILFLPVSIYLFLAICLGAFSKKQGLKESTSLKKFAIVIPAHNEEKIIGRTLLSIKEVDYPASLFNVYVVADNCSDDTAIIARKMNALCIERYDAINRGKGHALRWFFDDALKNNLHEDVFLIIDADTIVSKNILKEMNKKFCEGAQAVNVRYEILNPGCSVTASIAFLGFLLRNLRYKGLCILGGSAQLLGNGMAFTSEIIGNYGWSATSITEDREQWAILYIKGVNVAFVDSASVFALMPETFKDFSVPRARWDMGGLAVNRRYMSQFLRIFFKKMNFASFFTFIEIITPPFTYYYFISIVFCIIALIMQLTDMGYHSFVVWLINVVMLSTGVFSGLLNTKADFAVYKNLLFYLPVFVPWRIWNLMSGYVRRNPGEWVRSKR